MPLFPEQVELSAEVKSVMRVRHRKANNPLSDHQTQVGGRFGPVGLPSSRHHSPSLPTHPAAGRCQPPPHLPCPARQPPPEGHSQILVSGTDLKTD